MTDNKSTKWDSFKKVLPYILVAAFTLGIVALGSIDKQQSGMTLSLESFAKSNYDISVDQLSEMYVVADLSDALNLASASDVASNYVVTTSMYDAGQTATGKLEKPSITNISVSRGVIEYIVKDGETIDSIAAANGISAEQIRWSNNLKNTATIGAGNVLYLPSAPGIVYTVKSGDTVESIAAKYGSTAAEITVLNDLEVSGVKEGARILIKNGTLPETERPDYVPPRQTTTYTNTSYRYSYLGSASDRQNIQVIYPRFTGAGGGQCVNWAYYMRPDLRDLYGWSLGNANTWAARATKSVVNRTPSAGAIFQTSSGWYGHVGYVEAVNSDGSITVTEMNYGYIPYRVIRSTIPAGSVGNFNYIH